MDPQPDVGDYRPVIDALEKPYRSRRAHGNHSPMMVT
jgi:hypothetical protein